MKYLIILCLLLCVNSKAQTTKKRPSWSQGLPEREQTLPSSRPALKFNEEKPTSRTDVPAMESVKSEKPIFKMEQFVTPELDFKIETEATVEAPVQLDEPVKRRTSLTSVSRFQNRSKDSDVINPLHNQYSWQVLTTTPIEVPSHLKSLYSINVDIYIKPDGSVSRVSSTDPNVTSQLLKSVSESVENWQFEAPDKIGITDEMSKNFTIEIES